LSVQKILSIIIKARAPRLPRGGDCFLERLVEPPATRTAQRVRPFDAAARLESIMIMFASTPTAPGESQAC
jgi:hypothetical protein